MYSPNLSLYLQRIKHNGNSAVTLENLKLIQLQHLLNVTFENLEIHINIDPLHIENRILNEKSGGIAFSKTLYYLIF